MKIKTTSKKLILLGIIIICFLVYFLVPQIKNPIDDGVNTLFSLNLEKVIAYIRSYGTFAMIISFFLMILQSIISPIPAFLITLANASIFGWVKGAILSWTSSMVGAALCFYIARILGQDIVQKIIGEKALKSTNHFFEKYGKHTILVCRLLPFVSFDIVSYAAGLTNISFIHFFVATGIGQLPATIVYSYLGQLTGSAKTLMIGLLILFACSIIIYVIKEIYKEKYQK